MPLPWWLHLVLVVLLTRHHLNKPINVFKFCYELCQSVLRSKLDIGSQTPCKLDARSTSICRIAVDSQMGKLFLKFSCAQLLVRLCLWVFFPSFL
uniref:Secreted protein n=1 Tax=Rhizophora mucronata TaxID=61149 RepID=A0A2P2NSL0_RHIMU